MIDGKRVLGIIPARGGSKGLPGKNILPIAGKPLVIWTIECAKKSVFLDTLIVSTENERIGGIAEKAGAGVPFARPAELATDSARTVDVILHALDWFSDRGHRYDIVVCLQPTSPLRAPSDIDNALRQMSETSAKAVVSVCENDHPAQWINSLPQDKCMKDFLAPEVINTPRQKFPLFYRLNGAVSMAETEYLRRLESFIGDETYAYIMPRERSIDIDTELDFRIAEYLLNELK
ncbi:MAG: CMP-N-acetlyneuraminic acid synthetase [Spirochaetes bacterium GWF1_51_8]|nr:MAG: CMP-N-acetlyneuraminic acid synthetase [Spirochaetes bacterium GWF1_51_8]